MGSVYKQNLVTSRCNNQTCIEDDVIVDNVVVVVVVTSNVVVLHKRLHFSSQ